MPLRFLTAFLSVAAAYGQTITGVVTDPQKAAIPGADVALVARDNTVSFKVTADRQGRYRFDRISPGAYLLEAEAQGFAPSGTRTVEVRRGETTTIDFHLKVAGVRTSVVVTASSTPQTIDEISKAVSVVDGQIIDLRGDAYTGEALRDVPGLRIQRLGGPGAFTTVKMRGLPSEDTAVLIDGFRFRDATGTQADAAGFLEDLTLANVDRLEVLRGAGSSLYGTNAIGGVVNVITAEGGGRTRGSLLAEGGTLGMFRGRAQLSGALKGERWRYSLGLVHLNVTGGLEGKEPARNTSGQGRVDYSISPKFRLFGRIFTSDAFVRLRSSAEATSNVPSFGIVDAVPFVTFVPAADNPDYSRTGRIFSGALQLSAHPLESVGLTASYQGLVTRRRFSDGPAGSGYQPSTSTFNYYDGNIHTANGRVDWQIGSQQALDAGYEFEREEYGYHAVDSAVAVSQRSQTLYVQDQVRLFGGRVQLSGGYRAQLFTLSRPAFQPVSSLPYETLSSSSPPTAHTADGSVAYFLRATGTKLRAHVGRAYRAPSLFERFGTYYSSFGYSAYGDPRLRPDRSIAVDGGIDQSLWNSRARLSGTYFYTRLQQVIAFDSTGTISPTVDPFGRYGGYHNTNGGLARGVEASAALIPTSKLSLDASYTYTNARDRTPWTDGVVRSYVVPDHQFTFQAVQRVSARLTVLFDFQGATNYLTPIFNPITYVSRAYRFPGARQAQAGASYRLPLDDTHALRFYGRADNIFNQTYFENGFRTPGTTAQGGLVFEF